MTSTRRPSYARVRITGEALDPLEVTQALRLPPDHTRRSGEPRLRRRRDGSVQERAPYPQGMWSMSSAGWVDSAELDAHLRWLLDQLEPRSGELQRLQEAGAGAELICYCTEVGPHEVPVPAQTLGRCGLLALPLVPEDYQDLDGEDE